MVRILCHSVKQKVQLYKIVPTRPFISEEFVLYLPNCVICNSPVLEIVRFDVFGVMLPAVRLKTNNVKRFLAGMSVIWKPSRINFSSPSVSRLLLGYNEFGYKRKCGQNISNISIGKIDTNPYAGLISPKELLLIS